MTNETENPPPATPGQNPLPGNIPLLQTAGSMSRCLPPLLGEFDLKTMIREMEQALALDHGGNDLEALLAGQARVLDAAFHRSVADAGGAPRLSVERIELAMKAQRQFRATLETLRALQAGLLRDKMRSFKPLPLPPLKTKNLPNGLDGT